MRQYLFSISDNSDYDAVRAMMISTVVCVLAAILLFLVFKHGQKDPAIPVVILGIIAGRLFICFYP